MEKILIKDIPANNRPRERLYFQSAQALTDAEILAILLRTGSKNTSVITLANILLKKFGSLKKVGNAQINELVKTKGMGKTKAATIAAAYEFSKRIQTSTIKSKQVIKCPKDIYQSTKVHLQGKSQEHLYLLSLNTRHEIIKIDLISIGSINTTIFPLREIVKKALENNSTGIAIVHNHPSQNVEPSIEDITVTENLIKACSLVEIKFIDHVIVSDTQYFSIKSTNLNLERR